MCSRLNLQILKRSSKLQSLHHLLWSQNKKTINPSRKVNNQQLKKKRRNQFNQTKKIFSPNIFNQPFQTEWKAERNIILKSKLYLNNTQKATQLTYTSLLWVIINRRFSKRSIFQKRLKTISPRNLHRNLHLIIEIWLKTYLNLTSSLIKQVSSNHYLLLPISIKIGTKSLTNQIDQRWLLMNWLLD